MDRPITVSVASLLLVLNVLVLVGWWMIAPSDIESNGAQVFFSILWFSVGVSVFRGYGWVRYAILAVLIVFLIEVLNTGQPLGALQQMPFGDQASKSMALVALVLLFLPQSNQWFKQIKEYAKALEAEQSG
jgi:hypothetical protein